MSIAVNVQIKVESVLLDGWTMMNVATPKRFTIDEYHRLIELGFLTESDSLRDGKAERIELIGGELIQITAKGTPHTFSYIEKALRADIILMISPCRSVQTTIVMDKCCFFRQVEFAQLKKCNHI